MARPIGAIAPGRRADIVVLDADHPSLGGRSGDGVLDAYVFSGNVSPVRSVMVGGNWVVRDGRHAKEAEVAERYRRVVARLAA
jgi:formimidoylglutamate deiminase